jgi:hypothetical protein
VTSEIKLSAPNAPEAPISQQSRRKSSMVEMEREVEAPNYIIGD